MNGNELYSAAREESGASKACPQYFAAVALAFVLLFAGCRPPSPATASPIPANPAAVDLEAVYAQARASKRPVIFLITEAGASPADDAARALLDSPAVKAMSDRATIVLLDVGVSRNRALAGRFHALETPLLVSLSSRGVIAHRDEKPITSDLLLKRIAEAAQEGPALDAKLDALEEAVGSESNNADAKFALADFLREHQNALEAMPHLAGIAHTETNPPALRVRAWVDLAWCHLWIAEPEKGRHEATALMAALSPVTPEARAGGLWVLGLQDAKAKRTALARREFEDAQTAAPESIYGKQAGEELAKLPKPTE